MKTNTVLCASMVGLLWAGTAPGDQITTFVEGCLQAKGAIQSQCECMYEETAGEIPAKEAAFIIASMSGDMAAVQATAAELSTTEKQAALTTWPVRMDKCF